MNYLSPEIPWENIKAVGFDMDGTLYDEFDFIHQVYQPIAELFSNSNYDDASITKIMLRKWIEKGSSYPYIFSETLHETGWDVGFHKKKIEDSLSIYRNYKPSISLSGRTQFLLEELKDKYELFLVSDGSSTLQWSKIRALQLEKYFDKKNIFISGDYGIEAQKPGLASLEHIAVFSKNINKNQIVFIGDRNNDKSYANNAGMYYINISRVI